MDKKLAEKLWTARWAINAGKKKESIEAVTAALVHIGAEPVSSLPADKEPDRPSSPPPAPLKGITEPEFVIVKGVKFPDRGPYQTPSKTFEGLTIHYTVSGRTAASARAVVGWLASQGYGCMVMDEDGKIYIPEGFDVIREWGHHAGVSKWGNRSSVSKYFAGMEICCWGLNSKTGPYREAKKGDGYVVPGKYQTYTAAQEKALTNFILWARSINPAFRLENVVGHDELRVEAGKRGDKQDPGASLSMTMPAYREHLAKLEKNLKK